MIGYPRLSAFVRLCRATLLPFAIAAPFVSAAADTYPNHSLRIVVSFPPGTTTDTLARTVAQRLGDALGEPVIVENRPGALPDVCDRLISIGMVPGTSTPQQLAANIRAEVVRWGPIVKAAGIAQE